VRHAVAFVFRNWPLKVAAILLASLLYAGFIVSASAATFQGRIPIQLLNQPRDTFVLGNLEDVTSVRYLAIGSDRPQVTSYSFTVTVDLAGVVAVPGAPSVSLPVDVRSVDPAIQVIDFSPSRVAVRLDPLVSREVPVTVDLGTVPSGLDVRDPVVSLDPVTVSGPDSAVRSVAAALARVRLDPSGIDVNETVGLVPVDARGEIVGGADVQPSAVRVTIQIGSQLSTKTLPVSPVVTGTPASSVEITSVDVQPALVTVEGEADALAGLVSIDTRPVASPERRRRGDGSGARPAGRWRPWVSAQYDHDPSPHGHPHLRGRHPGGQRRAGPALSAGHRSRAPDPGRHPGGARRRRSRPAGRPPRRRRAGTRDLRGDRHGPAAGRRGPRLRIARRRVRDRDPGPDAVPDAPAADPHPDPHSPPLRTVGRGIANTGPPLVRLGAVA
jgi:hypothetical protein